jgi:hypothetical protein
MNGSPPSPNNESPERHRIVAFPELRIRDEVQRRVIDGIQRLAIEAVKVRLRLLIPDSVVVEPSDQSYCVPLLVADAPIHPGVRRELGQVEVKRKVRTRTPHGCVRPRAEKATQTRPCHKPTPSYSATKSRDDSRWNFSRAITACDRRLSALV